MWNGQRIVVVMPAYNAAQTLERTHGEVLEHAFVDEVILVDDASRDQTVALARTLPRTTVPSMRNWRVPSDERWATASSAV